MLRPRVCAGEAADQPRLGWPLGRAASGLPALGPVQRVEVAGAAFHLGLADVEPVPARWRRRAVRSWLSW
ncbi:hypothetical protein LCGC14_2967450, partial [marine sediment metagenome]